MAGISAYFSKQYLDFSLGGAAATQPAALWAGLTTGAPTSVSASEMGSTTSFSRVSAIFGEAASPEQSCSNNAWLLFGPMSSPGLASGLCIFDDQTINSGNLLFYGPLQAARTFEAGDAVALAPGSLVITLK
jgi:hypothetical protein